MSPTRPFLLAVLAATLLACHRDKPDVTCDEQKPCVEEPNFTLVQDQSSPALACFQRARERTLLSQADAFQLCRGAASSAPVSCYERAANSLLLSSQALALCRCAKSTAPIECFLTAQADTMLSQPQIMELCAATATDRLYQDCTPIR